MNEYDVEKSVPIPKEDPKVPLSTLEVGESILFELDKRSTVQTRASKIKRQTGKEFIVRKVDDKSARVWRTT